MNASVAKLKSIITWTGAAIVSSGLSGCVMYDWPSAASANTPNAPQFHPTVLRLVQPVEINRLETGGYCQLTTICAATERPGAAPGTSSHIEISKIAGRIVSIDDSDVVLDDVIRVEESQSTTTPTLAKVPYVNRLFKTTGVYVKCTPIPGELRVPRQSIRQAFAIESSAWPDFRRCGFVRVGVDFDFNIPPTSNLATQPAADASLPARVDDRHDSHGSAY